MDELIQVSDQMGYTFFKNKMFDLAYMQTQITLQLAPLDKRVRFNSARAAYYANKYEDAIEHISVCLMLEPEWEDAKRELALYLPWVGKSEQALKIIETLPKDARTMFNLGWYNLNNGKFLEGMKCLEYGRKINCWGRNDIDLTTTEWTGQDLTGKRLLVITEGGLGDEIIFMRFLKPLYEVAKEINVMCTKETKTIFDRCQYTNKVTTGKMYPEHDYWAPMMGLPARMGLEGVTGEPYLVPDQVYVDKWKQIINTQEYNIGFRWEGGQLFEHDQRRTLPAAQMVEDLKKFGNIHSLQKELVATKHPKDVIDYRDKLETIEDTIALISLMDIIVTSCTSVTHLAGALGKRMIVLVPIVPYFLWYGKDHTSNWYDSAYVCRQTNPYNWDDPINQCMKYINAINELT
jgi:tetratricopeptide (TPR) repeat protein